MGIEHEGKNNESIQHGPAKMKTTEWLSLKIQDGLLTQATAHQRR